MKKNILLVCISISLSASISFAQQAEKQHLFSIGAADYSLKDQTVSSSSTGGNTMLLNYTFLKQSVKRKMSAAFTWQKGSWTSGNNTIGFNGLSAKWSDGFLIAKGKRFSGYMGYAVTLNPSFFKIEDKTNSTNSWATTNSVDLYQSYQYRWKKNSVQLDIHVPVAALVSRPATDATLPSDFNAVLYDSYSNLELVSFDSYKAISVSLDYKRTLNSRWLLWGGISYGQSDLKGTMPVFQRSAGIRTGIALSINH
jgi:hypothetical protein